MRVERFSILGFSKKEKWLTGSVTHLWKRYMKQQKSPEPQVAKYQVRGGGGFMIFYCPGNTKHQVMKSLEKFGGESRDYQFVEHGLARWTV